MLLDRYYETIDKLYARIRETQRGNVLQAGKLIAESVQNGGAFRQAGLHSFHRHLPGLMLSIIE